jgi:hypothetical protein
MQNMLRETGIRDGVAKVATTVRAQTTAVLVQPERKNLPHAEGMDSVALCGDDIGA